MSANQRNCPDSKKLIDLLSGPPGFGLLLGVLATTYDLNPDFFEVDFLPSVFGLGAWDDRRWTSRIALERALARTRAVTVLMDGRRFQGRPRTLRVEVLPAVGAHGQLLHAKITLLVFENAVRLLVGSANLTTPGYRSNREAAVCLTSTVKRPAEGALIVQALKDASRLLASWWTEGAEYVVKTALAQLAEWGADATTDQEWFLWGGGSSPLWQGFLERWPVHEPVNRITIVSPFWSDESKTGPLSTLLSRLASQQCIRSGAELLLVTSAAPSSGRRYRPQLPAASIQFDPSPWGVNAFAIAANPTVHPDEVGGRDDVLRERALHAKIVLLEGPRSSLLYLGSGNFSAHGWGFLGDPTLANVEAGVVIQRTGKSRAALAALIPETIGDRVPLTGAVGSQIAVMAEQDDEILWPTFLRGVWLEPDPVDNDRLRLVVELDCARVNGAFSLAIPSDMPTPLVSSEGLVSEEQILLPLHADAVRELLRQQRVLVGWWQASSTVEFPVNVNGAARERLPFGPDDVRPTEGMLLAYYQGRIAWEELFPDAELMHDINPQASALAHDAAVDTSQIQSYQVRAFVEALEGIRRELREAAVSEPAIRMALLGPVSPVALAREIVANVKSGRRSPTAGGFQLVELLGCLSRAQDFVVDDRVCCAWNAALKHAMAEIRRLLDVLREAAPSALNAPAFVAYRRMVCRQSKPEAGLS